MMRLDRRILPVVAAVAIGAGAGVALELAVPGSSPAPAPRAPVVTPADPALARVLVPLDRARVRDRAALHRARTPGEQATLARRLADEHQQALTALAGRGGAPLADRLAATQHAYESLRKAVTDASAARYDAARRTVLAAEAGLTRAVDDAMRPRVTAPAAVSPPDTPGSSGLLDWVLIVAALAAGLVIGLVKPPGRPRAAVAADMR
jgi:hypothetical protein